ncbi:MAG: hypothetical protein DRH30_10430 [Deltaproteobacteria bacterium]|nr:MAG: hypothetical protein DRH30_10430 [Deltaproteobacteria bacterium]
MPTPPSAIKNDNSCPGCGELVDVDEGFDGAPFRCDGCGKRSIWTAFDGGYFQLIESGEEDDN